MKMTTATDIKKKLAEMDYAADLENIAYGNLEKDPENEVLESIWEGAMGYYEKTMDELAEMVVEFTNGQIDLHTATQMLIFKQNEFRALCARVAG